MAPTAISSPTYESFPSIESPVQFNNTDGDTSDGSDDFDSDDNNTDSNFDNSNNDISVEGIDYGNDDGIDEDLLNIRNNTSNEFTGSNNNFDALENETDDEAEELYDDLHEKNDTTATSINDSNNTSKTEDDNDDDDDDDYDDNDEDDEDDDDADDEDDLSLDESMKSLRRSSGGPSRFFEEADISIRCYRCGGVGHMAMECVNEPLQRCCFRCGETGHDSRNCKNEVCYNCFETGHIAANCKQARRGTLDVTELKDPFKGLKAPFKELEKVRCMTCDKLGHINCEEVVEFGEIEIYCYMCGQKGHVGTDCSKNYGRPQNNGSWRRGQQDNGYNNRYARDLNCYKCGNQGHIARDCPQVSSRNNNNVNKKRGRRYSPNQDYGSYNNRNNNHPSFFQNGNRNGQGRQKRFKNSNGRAIGRGGHSRR